MNGDDDTTRPVVDTLLSPAPPPAAPRTEVEVNPRYALGAVLGRGGMGEVRLADDTRIEREVAVKLMHGQARDAESVARFLREARVQGGLEHPAVVPVHDLGIDAAGNPYFVMKRLAGITLADVLRAPNPRWPRRQLLSRFVDVCLAIEFAHTRGVVHRDIKPANLMLGDFGEAYVLDWGLAALLRDRPADLATDDTAESEKLVGTPGYMSPEQARGEPGDARSDVFALGITLYEILAGAPAMKRGLPGLTETLTAAHHRPSVRAPDVPPELDDLCARATAQSRELRPTARELAEAVQAYLDGDRDLARRRELATQHAARAQAAFANTDDDARATAMREAGHALVLDPSSSIAKDVLAHLMLEAPMPMPVEARAAADDERVETRRKVLLWGRTAYAGLVPVIGILTLLPLHSVWPIIASMIMTAAVAVFLHVMATRDTPLRTPWFIMLLLLNMALMTAPGLIFGPLLVMPIFVCGSLGAYLSQPAGYPPWLIIATHVVPIPALIGLELLGVLPSTFRIEDGGLQLTSWVVELTPVSTVVIFVVCLITQFANTSITVISARRAQDAAQDRVHAQSWHLRQLVPHQAASASWSRPAPPQ